MRSIKIMLLGISIMLVALYLPYEFRTAGFEIFLLGLGVIFVIIGFFIKDKKS